MLINTDLTTDNPLANLQNQRTQAGASASPSSPLLAGDSAASSMDPSLQRLTDLPAGVQDADWAIQDEEGAGQALDALQQGMAGQPGTALAAQANQLSANVLSLLSSTG